MSTEINLLPQKARSRLSHESALAYAKIGAIVVAIITVCLAVLVFLINRDPTLERIGAEQNTILAQLSALHSKTAKDLIIQDRLRRIHGIVTIRGNMDTQLIKISSQLPSSLTVTDFSLDSTKMSITVSSLSLSGMGELIDNLTKLVNEKSVLKGITIQGIITDEQSGTYLMTVTGVTL
ncbi:MAG TPA: hypothetical protein VN711_00610 [Candidatus Saccharimonadales bacterium]|nr:hypothetical protein [Candidatus Saccharimonadales bacterium]